MTGTQTIDAKVVVCQCVIATCVCVIDDYYTGPIQLIDGLLDVSKKAVLAQIEWTDTFRVRLFLPF